MRQAGIIAAGALFALRNNRSRLTEDHANARKLADGLAEIRGIEIPGPIETNIVRFRMPGKNASGMVNALQERGVLVFATVPESIRAVTHLQVSSRDVDSTLIAFRQVLN
jgi:threonine aldolase